MKVFLWAFSFVLSSIFSWSFVDLAFAETTQESENQESTRGEAVEAAEKETMKLTEHGIEPQFLTLKSLDASVFFVNTTKAGLASLEIQFSGKRAHCASENMKMENGVMKSIKPIGPHDFALLCFPEKGDYQIRVQGIDGTTKEFSAHVVAP